MKLAHTVEKSLAGDTMNTDKQETIADLLKRAYQVQDAANLSGVVHSFADDIVKLKRLLPTADTINSHPVCIMYSDKITNLISGDVFEALEQGRNA
jgi:hypothetical protein